MSVMRVLLILVFWCSMHGPTFVGRIVVINARPDLFVAEQRGLASSVYSVRSLFGPVIGLICGGFIAQRPSWRWVFWVLLMASSAVRGGIIVMNRSS